MLPPAFLTSFVIIFMAFLISFWMFSFPSAVMCISIIGFFSSSPFGWLLMYMSLVLFMALFIMGASVDSGRPVIISDLLRNVCVSFFFIIGFMCLLKIAFISLGTPGSAAMIFSFSFIRIPGAVPIGLCRLFAPFGILLIFILSSVRGNPALLYFSFISW